MTFSYLRKAASGLRDAWSVVHASGWRAGLNSLRGKLWRRSCSILYRKTGKAEVIPLPEGMHIVRVDSNQPHVPFADMLAAGAGSDVRYLRSGASCFLAYLNGVPVGLGWLFTRSYMMRRARVESHAAYLGGFHTVEAARGRGVYPLLLRVICADPAVREQSCYVDADPNNHKSIRGIEKAGFDRVGELKAAVVCGVIVRCVLITARAESIARPHGEPEA